MEHDAAVEEVGVRTLNERGVLVNVTGAEGGIVRRNSAVLAGKIADLARLGLTLVADGVLASLSRVKVSAGCCAVAVLGDGFGVNVVSERATLRQAAHFNIELHSNAAIARLGYYLALDVATIREAVLLPGVLGKDRFGNETRGIVGHSCSCGESRLGSNTGSGRAEE